MKKKNYVKRILAIVLAMVMVASGLPDMGRSVSAQESGTGNTIGVISTTDDPQTLTRPLDTYGNSTLNAGKILVGKSVMDSRADGVNGTGTLDLRNEMYNMKASERETWTPGTNNFLVTVSQSSQMYGISSRIPVPMDVVFVIDTSGSMETSVGNKKDRADVVVEAANTAISNILGMNEHNRVAVVGFSDGASTLSELRHYTGGAASQHITWSGDWIFGRNENGSVNSGVLWRNGRNAHSGGTNIHAGVVMGGQILTSVADNDTFIRVDTDGDGTDDTTMTRMPVLIILSDGAATYSMSDPEWWDFDDDRQGSGDDPYAGNGFLAALSAAYYKQVITTKYYGANASQSAGVYTMGIGLDGDSDENKLARVTMDPAANLDLPQSTNAYASTIKGYWEQYVRQGQRNQGSFDIQVNRGDEYEFHNYNQGNTIDNIDSSVTSLKYNDKYYSATSTEQIIQAFEELVIEIQKRAITVPTMTNATMGQDFSGYVTFTDPIGEYMEVKKILGVTGDGYLYQGKRLANWAELYDQNWPALYEANNNYLQGSLRTGETTDDVVAFFQALEQGLMDRIRFSNQAGDADPSLDQIRQILDVVTMTSSESPVKVENAGGGSRTFDYGTYGGQLYYNSDSDYGNSFTWFGNLHYLDEGVTAANAEYNDEYSIGFIGVAPKNADSVEKWLKSAESGDASVENSPAKVLAQAKEAGANVIVRSYFMYGAAGGNRTEPADMLHFQVRVITSMDEPHQQFVSIKAPASLLAMQKVLIDDTDSNNPVAHYDDLIPTRVTYEVGLRSDIDVNNVYTIVDEDYLKTYGNATYNADGSINSVNFFANDFKRYANEAEERGDASGTAVHDHAYANVTFDVSNSNSFYRYEQNTKLLDAQGKPITSATLNPGKYYYERTYYEWDPDEEISDGVAPAEEKTERIEIEIPAGWQNSASGRDNLTRINGEWHIVKGTYTASTRTAGDDIQKTDNETKTAHIVSHPQRTDTADDPSYTVWLGNNGKLTFAGVKTKDVTGDDITTNDGDDTTTSDVETNARIDGKSVMVGDVLTYTLRAVNTESSAATIVITDTIPGHTDLVAGSITASTGGVHSMDGKTITWTFNNVAAGAEVSATFKVKVSDSALGTMVNNQAQIKVGNNTYDTNITENPAVGKVATTPGGEELGNVAVDQPIEYHIAWYNDRDDVANITITDSIPVGTSYVDMSASHNPTLTIVDGEVTALTWTMQNVEPGMGGIVSFRVKPNTSIVADDDDTLDVENKATITFLNNPAIKTNEVITPIATGDLVLSKAVSGTTASATFELYLTESTGELDGTFAIKDSADVVRFTDGKSNVISLDAGQSITIEDLPIGVIISVNEPTPGAGYTASYSSPAVSITCGQDKHQLDSITNICSVCGVTGNVVGASLVVTNTYKTQPSPDINTMFKLKKTLNSVVDVTRTFGFIAQACDEDGKVKTGVDAEELTIIQEVTSKPSSAVVFGFSGKTFAQPGIYYYVISEEIGNVSNITYDTTQYLVEIEIKDNTTTAKLEVESVRIKSRTNNTREWPKEWSDYNVASDVLAFVNTYVPNPTSLVLTGTKELTGRDLIAGEFTFQATETSAPTGVSRNVTVYGRHDEEGNITFGSISYAVPGVYTYVVTELETAQEFVTFDTASKTVTVNVTGDGQGGLVARATYPEGGLVFENIFTTQPVTVDPVITGTKTLYGRPMNAGEFTFGVFDANGKQVATGRVPEVRDENEKLIPTPSDVAAQIAFSQITYSLNSFSSTTQPDENGDMLETFTYTIRELVPTVGPDDNITYDASVFTFTVTLKYDKSEGKLTATNNEDYKRTHNPSGEGITATDASVGFVNTYTPDPTYVIPGVTVGPSLQKTVVGENNADVPEKLTFGFQIIKAADATNLDGSANSNIKDNDRFEIGDVVGTGISGATTVDATTTTISFSTMTFHEPGIYRAWIVENAGSDAHGVTHDTTRYLMVITVEHDLSDGKLKTEVAYYKSDVKGSADLDDYEKEGNLITGTDPMTFTNVYSADGTMTITAQKVLENRNENRVFNFTLTEMKTENGSEVATTNVHSGQNDASGKITFDTLTFVADKTFDANNEKTLTYIMKEVPGSVPGIQYDQSEYRLTVKLTHNKSEATVTGKIIRIERIKDQAGNPVTSDSGDVNVDLSQGVVFTNVGKVYQGTSVEIPLSKVLTGRDMRDDEFGFTLVHWATNGQKLETPAAVDSVLVDATARGVADEMTITRNYGITVTPGTKVTYRIYENAGGLKGVTYDKSVYEFDVRITDNANGGPDGILEAAIEGKFRKYADANAETYTEVDAIEFANIYQASSILHTLKATKVLTGRDMVAGEFEFVVTEDSYTLGDGAPQIGRGVMATGRNIEGDNGVTVDVVFDPITYNAAGTYVYTMTEKTGTDTHINYNLDSKSYTVTVVVVDDQNGSYSVQSTTYKDATGNPLSNNVLPAFANEYTPDPIEVTLDIDKELTNRAMDAGEFGFTVTQTKYEAGNGDENTTETNVSIGSNAENGDINFIKFTVGAAGTYTFVITEDPGIRPGVDYATEAEHVITATVVVVQDADTGVLSISSITYTQGGAETQNPTFVNVYTPTPVPQSFYVTKRLTGMPMSAGQFTFTARLQVWDATNNDWAAVMDGVNQVAITGTNDAAGLVTFTYGDGNNDGVDDGFEAAGIYRWVVTEENPDPDPTDDKYAGTMTYDHNTYYVNVEVKDHPDTGRLSIGTVTYEKYDAAGNVSVDVITFENTFDPEDPVKPLTTNDVLKLNGSKVLNGRDMREKEFTFKIVNNRGEKIAIGTNDTNGNIIFDYDLVADGVQSDGIEFNAIGSYYYMVTELTKDDPDFVGSTLNPAITGAQITYDPAQWEVRFDVTQDPVTGELIVAAPVVNRVINSTATDTSKIVFTNTYDPVDAHVALVGHKELLGDRILHAGDFEFHLMTASGVVVARGYNDENGVITFSPLTFTRPTTAPINLMIKEVDQGLTGVTYDTTSIPVVIEVIDNVDEGKLVAKVKIDSKDYNASLFGDYSQIRFENKYKGLPGSVRVNAKKDLVGRPINVADNFEFVLTPQPDPNVVDDAKKYENLQGLTAYSKEDGTVGFDVRGLAEVGQYTFLMTETKGDLLSVTYSQQSYQVIIDVTDPGSGYMVAQVSYKDANGDPIETPVFTNTYTPDPEIVTINATKVLNGRTMQAGEFQFVIKDAAGNVLAKGTNDADGKILFGEFKLGEGTHELHVSEVAGTDADVKYDTTTYVLKVDVVNVNNEGKLLPTVFYPAEGVVFKNTYEAPQVYVPEPPAPPAANPDTGDTANIGLWVGLIAASAVVIISKVVYDKKRRRA